MAPLPSNDKAQTPWQPDPQRGFLPTLDPLATLPSRFAVWDEVAAELPKLLIAGQVRRTLEDLPQLDADQLSDELQYRRAMLILSYLGHAYVWAGPTAADRLPATVAMPWYTVARRCHRPPMLSYASYAMDNWRRLDLNGPIRLGNIVLLQEFLGGIDEEWFILVHVEIEAKAAPGLAAILPAQAAVTADEPGQLIDHLDAIAASLQQMWDTLKRMPEHCDPYIYYNRVRPYIHGWKDHPALPDGVVYEGVEAYGGKPQRFRGETGAQSSIIPSLDAALGVVHRDDPLRPYLQEMREYMPPHHRVFVESVEQGPSIRSYVLERGPSLPELRRAYNECVQRLASFRTQHLGYAHRYIHSQSQVGASNPTQVGTGGTPFMPYLRKHRDETLAHLIEG